MNYVYKAIRNETKRAYSVVSEIIKAHAYSSMSRKRRAKFLVMAFLLSFSGNAYADLTREQEEVFDAVMNAWAEGHGMHYFSVVKDPRKNDGHGHTIADGNADNKGATGYGSIAIGQNAATTTNFGMAIGYEAATEGQYALAVGTGAKAKTNFSTAIGKGANGAGKISLAVGYLSQALGKQATVFGGWAQVKNNAMNGLAIGTAAYVGDLKTDSPEPDIGVDRYKYRQVNDDEKPDPGNEHNNSIAIGAFANSFGYQSLSLGPGATTYDFDSMALGAAARAQGNFAIALGKMSIAEGRNTMALGHLSQACGEGSVSLGAYSLVDDGMVNSLALGSRSVVEAENSVALGADARVETLKAIDGNAYLTGNKDYFTAANGVVSVGHGAYTENDGNVEKTVPASYRRIINVAGGQADHDVVNVAQLKALETKLTQKGVKYFSVNSDTYKKAQPAGTADNSGNDGAYGESAMAIGMYALAGGNNALAIGRFAMASGQGALAIGYSSVGKGMNATSFGTQSRAMEYATSAFGYQAQSWDMFATAFGSEATAIQGGSTAMGYQATATHGSTAVGVNSFALGKGSLALGVNSYVGDIDFKNKYEEYDYPLYYYNEVIKTDANLMEKYKAQFKDELKGLLPKEAEEKLAYLVIADLNKSVKFSTAVGNQSLVGASSGTALGWSSQVDAVGGIALGSRTKAIRKGEIYGYNPLSNTGFTNGAEVAKYIAKENEYNALQTEMTAKENALKQAQAALQQAPADKEKQKAVDEAYTAWDAVMQKENHLLGAYRSARETGAVAVGNEETGMTRQITGVAAGSQDTDAVNVAQLKALATVPMNFYFGGVKDKNNVYTSGNTNWSMPLNEFRMDFGDGIKAEKIEKDGKTYTLVTLDKESLKGDPAFKGDKGENGQAGKDGTNGTNGKSAYEIWRDHEEGGTQPNKDKDEQAFLASLKGKDGEKGKDGTKGTDGTNGKDGKSAYELWKEQPGNDGKSEQDFLNGLKGKDGAKGADGTNGKSAYELWKEQKNDQGEQPNKDKTEKQFLESLQGKDGKAGTGADIDIQGDTESGVSVTPTTEASKKTYAIGLGTKIKAGEVTIDGTKDKENAVVGDVKINGEKGKGTITGLSNKTWDVNKIVSGRAATEDQLQQATQNMQNHIYEIGKHVNGIAASNAALAGLHPLEYDEDDKWNLSAAIGNYKGANAFALGAFYRPNERTLLSVGGTLAGEEHLLNVGLSLKTGPGTNGKVYASRAAMAREIQKLKEKDAARDVIVKKLIEQDAKKEAEITELKLLIKELKNKIK